MYKAVENTVLKVENINGDIVVSSTFDEHVIEKKGGCFDSCCYDEDDLAALFDNDMHVITVTPDELFDTWMMAGFIDAALTLKAMIADVS